MGYISKDFLRKEFENMVTVVVTEIISRKREFAMLQSSGMTNDQLRKMLICEGISYVVISVVISFLIGSPLSWLVLNAINFCF